jgi:hypothetical protein
MRVETARMKRRALWLIVVAGAVYLTAGLVFGALAGQATSSQSRVAWRWAAWLVSSMMFGGHILYEHIVLRSTSRITALRVSSAAGLGAFGLAAAANLHALNGPMREPRPLLVLSLAIWPIITMLPAFVVAWVAAALLARTRRNS